MAAEAGCERAGVAAAAGDASQGEGRAQPGAAPHADGGDEVPRRAGGERGRRTDTAVTGGRRDTLPPPADHVR